MKDQNQKQLPFIPCRTNLLLEAIQESDKVGSIYLPDSVRKPINQGVIVAMGGEVVERRDDETDFADGLKEGDIVVFPLHVEHRMEVDRRKFIIISEQDVLLTDRGHFASLQKEKDNGEKTK